MLTPILSNTHVMYQQYIMAFCSYGSFSRFCQTKNTIPYMLPSITAAFDTLTALGQVSLTGISGNFATYSVLNNGATVATSQTASTYTITGLGNNVQIGPVTVVPYDSQGVAGTAFTVTGGGGQRKHLYVGASKCPDVFGDYHQWHHARVYGHL